MRAINHAMTGAIIGLAITNPVALPLAFASHYVLDSVPHHGNKDLGDKTSLSFKITLLLDALLCVALVAVLLWRHPAYWWLASVSAFLAASPDFMWFGNFLAANSIKNKKVKELKHRHAVVRLHGWIQWFQKPIGFVVEIAWAILALVFLFYMTQH